MDPFALTADQAETLALLPLRFIQREYPNALLHVLHGPEDVRSPKELHPAFYGCFDWHSAVHGHWMLIRLLRLFTLSNADEIRKKLDENLSASNIQAEARYFETRPSFERLYGWAWLLKLCEELHARDDPDSLRWAANLRPLEERIVRLFSEFLPTQTYPIRIGTHGNTAFGLSFALDYAASLGHTALGQLVNDRAADYYLSDRDMPAHLEPGGNDFFSPALIEADLMRRVLRPAEFKAWFQAFLPDPSPLLAPAFVSDRSDPQIGHLDGLNLSRAWCLRAIATATGSEILMQAAVEHLQAGLDHVSSGRYEGEHWLATFAVYALTGDVEGSDTIQGPRA